MNKAKIIATFTLAFASYPLLAQAAETATSSSSFMSGPNLMLGLVAIAQIIAIASVAGYIRKISGRTDQFIKMRKLKESQNLKPLILLALFFGLSKSSFAQDAAVTAPSPFSSVDPNTVMLVVVNFVLLLVFIYVVRLLFRTVSWLMPPKTAEEIALEAKAVSKQTTFTKVLTDAVPVEDEEEILLDHEYDGIRELDNNLPPWWVWMFYATIVYAFVYLIYYHVLPYGKTQEEKYIVELQEAEMEKQAYLATAKNLIDENSVVYLEDASDLAAGKKIYMDNCQACHAPDGGGGVGPNFTDDYWLHGGSISDIFKVVKYGVPAKGMIAWESQLNPMQMAQVTSFIRTLSGTIPASPKEPQGEIWHPENSEEIAPDSLIKEEPLTPVPNVEKEEPDKTTAALQ